MSTAPDFDMAGMGMMPMGMEATPSSFSTAYLRGQLPPSDVSMRVDDLLDLSNKEDSFDAAAAFSGAGENNHQHGHLPMHEPLAAAGSLDTTSGSYSLGSFSDEYFYMPASEEVAELEWLSRFVDDSFSDVPFSSSMGGCADGGEGATGAATSSKYNVLRPECSSSIPGRARSKRSRAPAALFHQNTSSTWSSPHSPPFAASPTSPSPSLSEVLLPSVSTPSKPKAATSCRKKEEAAAGQGIEAGGVRRCTHCALEKTPQWRTGPLGPKTLCNACGVRYKSGRLVPEYRPAASPTFVLTQHSNSHRKVMELRRQKELLLLHHHHHHHHQGGATAAIAPSSPPPGALFGGFETC